MPSDLLTRMTGRTADEASRSATPLELFFDLVFVVAVSLASHELLHFLEEDHAGDGVIRYLMVFFAIWWAWMNFTWFANEYDTDDWLYRVVTLVQMAGVLVVAAGVPDAMNELDNTVLVIGYVVMRMALVSQWVRAAIQSPETRQRAVRYAVGVTGVQVLWVAALLGGWSFSLPLFLVGAVLELAVPVFAERAGNMRVHVHHVAERYGLFTIIVLGESVLASTDTIVAALEETGRTGAVVWIAVLGFVTVAAMWWLYFAVPQAHLLNDLTESITWGYGHYVVFASAAAVSVGISMAVASLLDHTDASDLAVALALCVPVSVFTLAVWLLTVRHERDRRLDAGMLGGALAVLAAAVTPVHMEIVAVVMVALVGLMVHCVGGPRRLHRASPSAPHPTGAGS